MNNSIPYLQYFTNNFNESLSVEFSSWLQEEEKPHVNDDDNILQLILVN
jgi:hypothetical protein